MKSYGYIDDGNVADLRHKILQLKSNNEDLPKLLDNKICRVTDINQCVGSLLSMVSCVMSRIVRIYTTPREMEREVNLFLTNVHNIYITMNERNDKDYIPYWLSKYNFQHLLNLPKAMELDGPLINLWEGGNKGEDYLRFAKPIITDIHSNNFQIHARLNCFSERSLDSVVNYHIMNNSKQVVHDKYLEYVESKKYRKNKVYFTYDISVTYILYSTETDQFHA